MPAVPLLDTPTGDGPMRVNTPANPQMYAGVAAAGERLGAAVEGVGELGFKIKGVKDDATITKAVTQAMAARQDFLDVDLKSDDPKNQDPNTYLPRWQQKLQALQGTMGKDPGVQTLSEAAKLQFQTAMDRVSIMANVDVKTAAQVRIINDAKAVHETEESMAIQAGDAHGALAANDYMEKHNLRYPVEAAQQRIEIPRQVDLVNFTKTMMQDPITTDSGPQVALKQLQDPKNFPHLLPAQRQEAEFHASRMLNNVRSQIGNDLLSRKVGGQYIDHNYVENLGTKGLLTAAEVKTYLAPEKGVYDAATTAGLINAAANYDPQKDPAGEHAAQLLIGASDSRIPTETRSAMSAWVNDKIKAAQSNGVHEAETPVAKNVFETMKQDREENGAFVPQEIKTGATHWWGPNDPDTTKHVDGGLKALRGEGPNAIADKDIEDTFGKGATRESVLAQEQVHYAHQVTQMRSWLAANPKATDEQAETYRQSLAKPYVMAAVKQALTGEKQDNATSGPPSSPQKGQTATDAHGVKATWDGTKWVE